ncbi:UvrD-helicase domain-containing protein [Streptomyces californicus]|uniref:UvrD-helicase domain-containing protein n=1 Tax=Streptomyces californicus TaxID=67351 RepID=UPI001E3A4ED5|nr:UvrD-helicase domain-containing protein [Streptomyces californicus]MCC0574190.1 AAA family ATPase [Streptomyces californicus]
MIATIDGEGTGDVMARLGIHRDFLMEFAGLEKHVQKRVFEVFEKFAAATHAGLHLEKLTHQRDPRLRTIRITDFWRGVILKSDQGDGYLLLKVLPHDKANHWAANHRASVNAASQGIEMRDDVALERATTELWAATRQGGTRLFAESAYPDKVLRSLGVDAEIIPIVRLIPDEAHLDALHRVLPEQQYDVLLGLASGMSPEAVDREVVQVYATASRDATDQAADPLDAAMTHARGRIALVSGTEELREILERPFDAWRVFLHPSQYRIAYQESYRGPAQVLGGPGTGKTVVALHRAFHLARRLPADAPDGCILLTTYTRALAVELERCLGLLIADDRLRAKITVINVDALAYDVVRGTHGGSPVKLVTDQKEIKARWARIIRRLDLNFADVFLDQEWRHVVLAQDLRNPEAYLKAPRHGRGTALPPIQRLQAWRAIEAFEQQLHQLGERTFLQICAEATSRLTDQAEPPFRHVIVDEAQDLHPAQCRFLRALVPEGRDDLFIAGDAHQRIYGNKVSLRSLGISITGRSHRLRINYRTTHEILDWSSSLLTGIPVDSVDDDASLAGYRSTLHGRRPTLAPHPSKAEEIAAAVARIAEWTASGVAPEDIAVAVRFIQLSRNVATALERAGFPTHVLGSSAPGAGVRIATMHRMKGLEFRCVAVLGVSEGIVPMRAAITPVAVDPQQHQEDIATELSLLFVACTRAREDLLVSCHGTPSPFLAPVADDGMGAKR